MRISKSIKVESVKTDFTGGFTDCMRAVDRMLESYYKDGQVEILVTDNGIATVTVFPVTGEDSTVTVQLDYPKDQMILVDDKNNRKVVNIDIDKTDFDKLGESIIRLVDSHLKSERALSYSKALDLFSIGEEKEEGVIVKVGNKWRIFKKDRKSYWDAEYDTKSDAQAALRAYWANKQK